MFAVVHRYIRMGVSVFISTVLLHAQVQTWLQMHTCLAVSTYECVLLCLVSECVFVNVNQFRTHLQAMHMYVCVCL